MKTAIVVCFFALFVTACSTLSSPQNLQQAQHNINHCEHQPASLTCTQGIQHTLHFQAKHPEESQLTSLLDLLYNGKQAEQLFLQRVHTINQRADFFACNHHYFHATDFPVRWFQASEHISRRCLLGLGAQGCGSAVTFTIAKNTTNPKLYEWRQVVGDNILQKSFPHFHSLFQTADRVSNAPQSKEQQAIEQQSHNQQAQRWDIKQLTREQNITQQYHHHYLKKDELFTRVAKLISGVDLLDTDSRIDYGCQLLDYDDIVDDKKLPSHQDNFVSLTCQP